MAAIVEVDIQDFLTEGILKEKEFRQKVEDHSWAKYEGMKVLVKGCGSTPIPTWAYMIVTSKLTLAHPNKIMYGEMCSAIPILQNKETNSKT